MTQKRKHLLSTLLKTGVTLLLLYLVFSKISGKEIWQVFSKANKLLLILALLCFVASQWISADRLWNLFSAVKYQISKTSNYQLYLVGMFYNFFIPGGIGGDAYKIYVLNKEFDWSVKKLTSALFVDRFMGLTAIGILIIVLGFFIALEEFQWLIWTFPPLLVTGILASYVIVKKWFAGFSKVYDRALMQSLGVQWLQGLSVVLILASITDIDQFVVYVLVFFISSILSIFSFSGIGVREMIFYQAAILFSFDQTVAVAVGVLFSVLTGFVSLFGLFFHFKKSNSFVKENQYSNSIP